MADIDINLLGELQGLWSSKNWVFQTEETKATAFNNLCAMFALLSPPQQQLVLRLTQSYSLHSYTGYQSLLIHAFAKITNSQIGNADQIILAPLINSGDDKFKRSKSGHLLPYIAEHVAIPLHQNMKSLKIVSLVSPDAIPNFLSEEKKSLIILLDDFIGSGDTAKTAVQHLEININNSRVDKNRGAQNKSFISRLINKVKQACKTYRPYKIGFNDNYEILVVGLVAMNHAVKRLSTFNIHVLSAEEIYKGIEENQAITDKAWAYKLIDEVEATLKINRDERRGYMKSEALLTMIRTPDNTFPIYWCKTQNNGSSWPAPFPR